MLDIKENRPLCVSFCRFMIFEMNQHILRRRWLLPLPIILFISYITISGVLVRSMNYNVRCNAWDAIFSVFGNSNILFFVVNVVFLYLISDLPMESAFGQVVLLRLGSRKQWWLGKILTLALAVLFYLAVHVSIVAAVSSFVLPWRNIWSEGAREFPFEFYLTPQALAISPLYVLTKSLVLLTLGWFGLGLFVAVMGQLFDHSLAGFSAGVFANLSGLVALRAEIPPPYTYLFIHQHILFNLHTPGEPSSVYLTFFASVLYWTIWIVIFSIIGFQVSLRRDFLLKEETK